MEEIKKYFKSFVNYVVELKALNLKKQEIGNKIAVLDDEIVSKRIEERQKLAKALSDFDNETQRLKNIALASSGLEQELNKLDEETEAMKENIRKTRGFLEDYNGTYKLTDDSTQFCISKTKEMRSAGISLTNIVKALVDSGTFGTESQAKQTIQDYNKTEVEQFKVEIPASFGMSASDIPTAERPKKKQKTQK